MRATALRRKAATVPDALTQKFMLMLTLLATLTAQGQRKAHQRHPGSGLVQRARQAQTVITVVVIGVVSLVGLLIFAQVSETMPETDGPLNGTQDSIVEGFGSAMEFIPIVMLVMLALVVIGVVQRMRA